MIAARTSHANIPTGMLKNKFYLMFTPQMRITAAAAPWSKKERTHSDESSLAEQVHRSLGHKKLRNWTAVNRGGDYTAFLCVGLSEGFDKIRGPPVKGGELLYLYNFGTHKGPQTIGGATFLDVWSITSAASFPSEGYLGARVFLVNLVKQHPIIRGLWRGERPLRPMDRHPLVTCSTPRKEGQRAHLA